MTNISSLINTNEDPPKYKLTEQGHEMKNKETQIEPLLPVSMETSIDSNQHNTCSYYHDHLEHLEHLELEAKLMLARLFFRVSFSDNIDKPVAKLIGLLELKRKVSNLADIEIWQAELQNRRKQKEVKSVELNIELPFLTLCSGYKLDPTARLILLVVIVANTSAAFKSAWEKHFEDEDIETGRVLSLLGRNFRDRILNRSYLSLKSPLLNHSMLKLKHYRGDSFDNWEVEIGNWVIPHVLDDQNQYDTSNLCISEQHPTVTTDRLVLPVSMKEKVLACVSNYNEAIEKRQQLKLYEYFDYGNGLVLLFHGPSGTGKTMLAHALANELDCPLYNLDLGELAESDLSFEEGIKSLFRQARLGQGIAFIDECDDILRDNCSDSRSMLIEMEKADCIIIMATNRPTELDPAFNRRITMKVPFKFPNSSQREALWKSHIPPSLSLAPDVNLAVLAQRFVLNGGLIKNAVQMAVNAALQNSTDAVAIIQWPMLVEAAAEQARCMFNTDIFYRPTISISALPICKAEQIRLTKISRVYNDLNRQKLGFCSLLSSFDIDTGILCVDAFAAENNLAVRQVFLSDVLSPQTERKYQDPVTQEEISIMEHTFGTKTGEEHILLIIDRSGDWDIFQKNTEKDFDYKMSIRFLEHVRAYKGVLFVLTDAKLSSTPPIQFSYSITLGYPEKTEQINSWLKYISNIDLEEIKLLTEEYSLYLFEIDSIGRQLKTIASIESEDGLVNMENVRQTIIMLRGKRNLPELFGRRHY